MTTFHYVLNDKGEPAVEPDLLTWARWFEHAKRHVGLAFIGDSKVSTVFLGLDHNWCDGPPVLWETMIFGGARSDEMDRCAGGREQAEAMHQQWVERTIESEFTWWRSFKRSFLSVAHDISTHPFMVKVVNQLTAYGIIPVKPRPHLS